MSKNNIAGILLFFIFFSSSFIFSLDYGLESFPENRTYPVASECPNSLFVIPSNGKIGWSYRYPESNNPDYSPRHTGIDILGGNSDVVYAAYNGLVTRTTTCSNSICGITILHEDLGVETYYTHMSEIFVEHGSVVFRGQAIGLKGNLGTNITHLHFSVSKPNSDERYLGNSIDPSPYLGANVNFDHGTNTYGENSVLDLCYGDREQHLSTVLIIDATGSMLNNDPNRNRVAAAKAFIDSVNYGDRVALVSFNTNAYTLASMTTITSEVDRQSLKDLADQIVSSGATNLNAGLDLGFSLLLGDSVNNNKKAAILLTDGIHNYSGPYQNEFHLQYANEGWPVHTIGLSDDADQLLLQRIAQDTKGEFEYLDDPSQLQSLYFSLSQTLINSNFLYSKSYDLVVGDTNRYPVLVPQQQTKATFYVGWNAGDVNVDLIDPYGRHINTRISTPKVGLEVM